MNDVIKEIIELINTKYEDYYIDDFLSGEDVKKLADYITNLQQKVEQYENPEDLTLFYMWLDEKAKDKMKELQQENQDLKRMCELYGESLYNADLTKCKARIDKAIEYINLYAGSENNYCLDYHDLNPLLNILKGDSND